MTGPAQRRHETLGLAEVALPRGLDRERHDHPVARQLRRVPPAIFAGFEQRLRRNGVGLAEIEHHGDDGETIDLVARDAEPAHRARRDPGGIDQKSAATRVRRAVFSFERQHMRAVVAAFGRAQAKAADERAAARRNRVGQHRVERRAVEVPALALHVEQKIVVAELRLAPARAASGGRQMTLGEEILPDAEPAQHPIAGRRDRLADRAGMSRGARISATTTSATPRRRERDGGGASRHAAADDDDGMAAAVDESRMRSARHRPLTGGGGP